MSVLISLSKLSMFCCLGSGLIRLVAGSVSHQIVMAGWRTAACSADRTAVRLSSSCLLSCVIRLGVSNRREIVREAEMIGPRPRAGCELMDI